MVLANGKQLNLIQLTRPHGQTLLHDESLIIDDDGSGQLNWFKADR